MPQRISLAILLGAQLMLGSNAHAAGKVAFDRDVRPLLADKCFACHGPDVKDAKGDLRLDRRDSVVRKDGTGAVVPGKPQESELIRRILSSDGDEQMPPPDSHRVLTAAEKETLRRWVAEGAEYTDHWAFAPASKPPLPPVRKNGWVRNAIDHFVLAGLEGGGMKPSAEAGRETLIRRVSLDLRGLPPTLAEIDAFLKDKETGAYERMVERMLASPHYGEKVALIWMDLARYGDTSGYHNDSTRDTWPWRDWVIKAYNDNMPFDRFTIEQLGGDLLPNATEQQKIASGFNRNARFNEEGGADPDEWLVRYAVDRTITLGRVWLGLTLNCAECHSHKYDPVSQKEFYELYAFFNSLEEVGAGGMAGFHNKPVPPVMRVANGKSPAASQPISVEMAKPRPAFVLLRGDFQQKGDRVERDVPTILPRLPADGPRNRLALARWLFDPRHPLTARVTVNRLWAQLFGRGVVETIGDFGRLGRYPSHPELLDWMAVEFRESGWDTKHMFRLILNSATYRQGATNQHRYDEQDPANVLLSRSPRYRLMAEEIRDGALRTSGLLSEKIGGPPVFPFQPANYYAGKNGGWKWNLSSGEEGHRRGMYTFWRRTTPYPTFVIFDAPDRAECIVSRPRTNTPLQALTTMNEPEFVEAARAFAKSVVSEDACNLDAKLTTAFRRATARTPGEQERKILSELYQRRLEYYRQHPGDAAALMGDALASRGRKPSSADVAELAAWINVTNAILNLDEFIMRE